MKIIVTKRWSDWHACYEGKPGRWGRGRTKSEAVGDLLLAWPPVEIIYREEMEPLVRMDFRVEEIGEREVGGTLGNAAGTTSLVYLPRCTFPDEIEQGEIYEIPIEPQRKKWPSHLG